MALKKLTFLLRYNHLREDPIINIIGRRVLRLVGIAAIAVSIPQLALAFDSGSGAEFKLAMGPTSAAQKNQSLSTNSDTPVANCTPSEATCTKPLHRSKKARTQVPPRNPGNGPHGLPDKNSAR